MLLGSGESCQITRGWYYEAGWPAPNNNFSPACFLVSKTYSI